MRKGAIVGVLCIVASMLLSVLVTPGATAGGVGWGTAQLIETDDTGDAVTPQVAVDPGGNATAVWVQHVETTVDGKDNIWANRYVVGAGWGTAVPLVLNETGANRAPQVAVDPGGNAMVVWCRVTNVCRAIHAERYVVGAGWREFGVAYANSTRVLGDPRVAVDRGGNATVVWAQDDRYSNIYSNRYLEGSGWTAARRIEAEDSGDALVPQVAVDPAGDAIAVWQQANGTLESVWANRYDIGSGWGTAQAIETYNAGDAVSPRVAVDAQGNAVAVWSQGLAVDIVYANRYVVGTGWGTPEVIGDVVEDSGDPQVAVDPIGNAVAVWWVRGGGTWANRYVVGTGWGTAGPISTGEPVARDPQVAVDSNGNAVAVWWQSDRVHTHIWSNRYAVGAGWGTPELVETDTAGDALYPQVALGATGGAVVVWQRSDGTRYSIWANRPGGATGYGVELLAGIAVVAIVVAVVAILLMRSRRKRRAGPAEPQRETSDEHPAGQGPPPGPG